jgi:hypothetical protein
VQCRVDADRNKRCVEEGMLHGFRTRAAGSDAEVAAPVLSLYLIAGCEFSRVPTRLTLAIVEAKSGSQG